MYKSTDYGAIWSDITGDLPEFGSTQVIVEHPRNPNLLFVGTESQVFVSITAVASGCRSKTTCRRCRCMTW